MLLVKMEYDAHKIVTKLLHDSWLEGEVLVILIMVYCGVGPQIKIATKKVFP